MSELFNPYAVSVLGSPLPQKAPPQLRAEGRPMTRPQLDMARFVFGRFLEQARLSYVPNPTQHGFLPDGSRFRIIDVAGFTTMQVWPVGEDGLNTKPDGDLFVIRMVRTSYAESANIHGWYRGTDVTTDQFLGKEYMGPADNPKLINGAMVFKVAKVGGKKRPVVVQLGGTAGVGMDRYWGGRNHYATGVSLVWKHVYVGPDLCALINWGPINDITDEGMSTLYYPIRAVSRPGMGADLYVATRSGVMRWKLPVGADGKPKKLSDKDVVRAANGGEPLPVVEIDETLIVDFSSIGTTDVRNIHFGASGEVVLWDDGGQRIWSVKIGRDPVTGDLCPVETESIDLTNSEDRTVTTATLPQWPQITKVVIDYDWLIDPVTEQKYYGLREFERSLNFGGEYQITRGIASYEFDTTVYDSKSKTFISNPKLSEVGNYFDRPITPLSRIGDELPEIYEAVGSISFPYTSGTSGESVTTSLQAIICVPFGDGFSVGAYSSVSQDSHLLKKVIDTTLGPIYDEYGHIVRDEAYRIDYDLQIKNSVGGIGDFLGIPISSNRSEHKWGASIGIYTGVGRLDGISRLVVGPNGVAYEEILHWTEGTEVEKISEYVEVVQTGVERRYMRESPDSPGNLESAYYYTDVARICAVFTYPLDVTMHKSTYFAPTSVDDSTENFSEETLLYANVDHGWAIRVVYSTSRPNNKTRSSSTYRVEVIKIHKNGARTTNVVYESATTRHGLSPKNPYLIYPEPLADPAPIGSGYSTSSFPLHIVSNYECLVLVMLIGLRQPGEYLNDGSTSNEKLLPIGAEYRSLSIAVCDDGTVTNLFDLVEAAPTMRMRPYSNYPVPAETITFEVNLLREAV